jgi:hypothetical protein
MVSKSEGRESLTVFQNRVPRRIFGPKKEGQNRRVEKGAR